MADEYEADMAVPEDDLCLPRATVIKLISEVLPDEILCARETKELILECCMEFVHLIASECNDICNKTTKKTINADHVLQSLKNLGFEGYLDEVKEAYDEHKKDQKERDTRRSNSSKFGDCGMTEEELMKQQEGLFKAARAKYEQQIHEVQPTLNSPTLNSPVLNTETTSVMHPHHGIDESESS